MDIKSFRARNVGLSSNTVEGWDIYKNESG